MAGLAEKLNRKQEIEPNVVNPQEGGQTEFLSRDEFEVFFGGAAGPGKSWALIIDALGLNYMYTPFGIPAVMNQDYRGIIFRRETPQLGNLIDEAKRYYCKPPFNAKFIGQRRGAPGIVFHFPWGSEIYLAHMENEKDKHNHDGFQYQFVGFDELTQFSITQYLHLFSRARSIIVKNGFTLNPRIRSTSNPIGLGLMWVKRRFVKNGSLEIIPNYTYYFRPDPSVIDPLDNPTGIQCESNHRFARSRAFIPGSLFDNKILMDADPNYMLNIMAMGKKYEDALLWGDWDAFSGDFFDDFSTASMRVQPFDIPESWRLVGSLDPGWSSPCSFGLQARDHKGRVYRLFTYYARQRSPKQNAKDIASMIKNFPYTKGREPEIIVAGKDAFAKKDKYAINETDQTWEQVFNDYGLVIQKATTDRVIGWQITKQYLRHKMWFYFDGWNAPLIDEIISAIHDDKVPEDLFGRGNDPNVIDHALDEWRYNFMAMGAPVQPSPDDDPKWDKKLFPDLQKRKDYSVHGV